MLNFRESLVKIRLSKLKRYGDKIEVGDIIEHLTEYFKLKTLPDFLSKTYLFFGVSCDKFYIQDRRNDKHNVFFIQKLQNEVEAQELLINLKEELQSEGYETINEGGGFSVEIDPSC